MRHIDISKLDVTEKWKAEATKAFYEVIVITDHKKRSKKINEKANIWGDLKENLKKLSNDKCWYCECVQGRSDTDVDHFRPKNAVNDDKTHEGYWWLAFDWTNYRHSCIYCNRPREKYGKSIQFPLLKGSYRAKTVGDDINKEKPVLLDPTILEDTECLWFLENGEIVPAFDKIESNEKNYRAEKSIEIYNLKHPFLNERRNEKINEIKRIIRNHDKLKKRGVLESEDIEETQNELKRLVTPQKEYYACMRAYLLGLRDSEHEWIDDVL